jgi:hypothetical protein
MEFMPLAIIAVLFYHFILQYLRKRTINRDLLALMITIVLAMVPHILDAWMLIAIDKLHRLFWSLLCIGGILIWFFRPSGAFWRKEDYLGSLEPTTPAERLAAIISFSIVILTIGLISFSAIVRN